MAYDRPSSKFLAFLEKHFELKHSVPQVNNFVVFESFFRNRSAAQSRKAPPKKPEGEIKPYSLMEREAVREEQKALPWPFTHSTAVPQSPPLAASSPYARSLSVGSSPSHTPRPQPHIPPHLADNCRTKRTSTQGLVARNNLYSRHVNSRGLGLLMAEQLKLPGLKPVLSEKVCGAGGQDTPGHRNTAESTQSQGSSVFRPPLPGVLGKQDSYHVALNNARSVSNAWAARNPRNEERDLWSWTVAGNQCTSQWVRQKHEFRSTRPW